ncbi:hypothetical protein [Micromonospora globbae]|uniref:hypothetical protein n=1 Tax=Micromonospora globbae TaxID=1894969 RepID=UPI0018646C76|nr:hypothetical protein [Micromonospora globbae]
MNVKPYAKAIVGGLLAGLGALGTALVDNSVTPAEWVGVATATLAGLGIVYAVPNRTVR